MGDDDIFKESAFWSNPLISSVLFCGTAQGPIVAYQILTEENELSDVVPVCLLFGHKTRVVSITKTSSQLYSNCIGSLSVDGTLSLISVDDFTIYKNVNKLFSENSISLSSVDMNSRLMIAAQCYGVFEVADVEAGIILFKVSGFSSLIRNVVSYNQLFCVSCVDGTNSIFHIIEDSAKCLFSFNVCDKSDCSFIDSKLSPGLQYALILKHDKWILIDSSIILFEQKINDNNDYYIKSEWISNSLFFISTRNGIVEIWNVDVKNETQIFFRLNPIESIFNVNMDNSSYFIKSEYDNKPKNLVVKHEIPKLKTSVKLLNDLVDSPIFVTPEELIIMSPNKSILKFHSQSGKELECNLSKYFNGSFISKCPIGNPIIHEARINNKYDIFLDDFMKPIGNHEGASILFSPPIEKLLFFSFSKDGSVKAWSKFLKASFYDLFEPVKTFKWIKEKNWLIVIGETSFFVIDVNTMMSFILCTNHDSQIKDIIFESSYFHVKCQSNHVYTWNIKGNLVSKKISKNSFLLEENRNLQKKLSSSVPNINNFNQKFVKTLPIIMPNCQTFVIIFDGLIFANNNSQIDSSLELLKLLWINHIGENPVFNDVNKFMKSLKYGIGGDSFSVSLPIILKPKTLDLPFSLTSYLSSVHSILPSLTSKAFISRNNDNLSLVFSLSQVATTKKIAQGIKPSLLFLANFLTFNNSLLSSVVIDLIQIEMDVIDKSQGEKIIKELYFIFNDYNIIFPFLLIYCKNYNINMDFGKKCAKRLFPYIFKQQELQELLLNCFTNFIQYFDSIQYFYEKLIEGYTKDLITTAKVIRFFLIFPNEAYDALKSLESHKLLNLIENILERWELSARDKLFNFMVHIMNTTKNLEAIKSIFALMAKKMLYIGYCDNYFVFGKENGNLLVVSFRNEIIWSMKISVNPIDFISISPQKNRFIVIIVKDKTLTWVESLKNRNYELVGMNVFDSNIIPFSSIWLGTDKVNLLNKENEVISEYTYPKSSFLYKLKGKINLF